MSFRCHGGKTVMVLPDGARAVRQRAGTVDNTMIKVLARGFRYQRLLTSGSYATIDELAAAEKINPSYVSRVLRLAFLSPRVVEAILDGKQPADLTMKGILKPFPMEWREQEAIFLAQSHSNTAK